MFGFHFDSSVDTSVLVYLLPIPCYSSSFSSDQPSPPRFYSIISSLSLSLYIDLLRGKRKRDVKIWKGNVPRSKIEAKHRRKRTDKRGEEISWRHMPCAGRQRRDSSPWNRFDVCPVQARSVIQKLKYRLINGSSFANSLCLSREREKRIRRALSVLLPGLGPHPGHLVIPFLLLFGVRTTDNYTPSVYSFFDATHGSKMRKETKRSRVVVHSLEEGGTFLRLFGYELPFLFSLFLPPFAVSETVEGREGGEKKEEESSARIRIRSQGRAPVESLGGLLFPALE